MLASLPACYRSIPEIDIKLYRLDYNDFIVSYSRPTCTDYSKHACMLHASAMTFINNEGQ